MSWMQKLAEAYDSIIDSDWSNEQIVLSPVGFIKTKVAIHVTVDKNGEFLHAERFPKNTEIEIPSYTDAEARTTDIGPSRPLVEWLKYVVSEGLKCDVSENEINPRYNNYIKMLEGWCAIPDSPWQLQALLEYMKKGTLLADLTDKAKLDIKLYADEKKVKYHNTGSKEFVAFSVGADRLWTLGDLRRSWLKYLEQLQTAQCEASELCYVTGAVVPVMKKHPGVSGRPKLVSSKDDSNPFQYAGRFPKDMASVNTGELVANKAYNALDYLKAKQGFASNGISYVAWNTNGSRLCVPIDEQESKNFWGTDEDEDEILAPDTFEGYSKALRNAALGYRSKLDGYNKTRVNEVCIVGMEAATLGRMSITMYQEMSGNDYIQRLEQWYESCCWYFRYWNKKGERYDHSVRTPNRKQIAEAVLGVDIVQQAFKDKKAEKTASKLMRQLEARLLACIILGRELPADFTEKAFQRAIKPFSFIYTDQEGKKKWSRVSWETSISVTCALIRKLLHQDSNTLQLEYDCTDRSYLYGRLCAAADIVECETAEKKNDYQTNAIRLFTRMANRPADTWLHLHESLLPYYGKLGAAAEKYIIEIGKIERLFINDDHDTDGPVGYRFLQGYYLERTALLCGSFDRTEEQQYELPQNRDALWGCLMAVADIVEIRATNGEHIGRTNALQNMTTMMTMPAVVWATIHGRLIPYLGKLGDDAGYYRYLLRVIEDRFTEDRNTVEKLGRTFLNSYYCMWDVLQYGKVQKSPVLTYDCAERPTSRTEAYGMLLGLASQAERRIRQASGDVIRTTNAERIISAFAMKPKVGWDNLKVRLAPYANKTRFQKLRQFALIREVETCIEENGWETNDPLGPEYIHSYYKIQNIR